MSFTGDHPIVENVLYDVSGSAIALTHSASIDMTTQAGIALAGVYSSSSGFTARVLQVDATGRLMVGATIIPSGTQTITGSVSISGPVTISQPVSVDDNGGSLTVDGSVDVSDGGGSLTVDDGGASLTVDGTVTANVTGTVNLDRGNNAIFPLFITGSIDAIASGVQTVTGTVAISGPVTINQPVSVTGTVNLDRGNNSTFPLFITGSVEAIATGIQQVTGTIALENGYAELDPFWISGSVAVNNIVKVDATIHTAASGTFFTSQATVVTIAAASTTRRGLTIYNESNKAMYIKFGAGASISDYTYKIFSDDGWTMPDFLYSGVITALWAAAGSLGAQVTIITP